MKAIRFILLPIGLLWLGVLLAEMDVLWMNITDGVIAMLCVATMFVVLVVVYCEAKYR